MRRIASHVDLRRVLQQVRNNGCVSLDPALVRVQFGLDCRDQLSGCFPLNDVDQPSGCLWFDRVLSNVFQQGVQLTLVNVPGNNKTINILGLARICDVRLTIQWQYFQRTRTCRSWHPDRPMNSCRWLGEFEFSPQR